MAISVPVGWYWVDPDLGVADDAIYAWCNMTAGGDTCVHPDSESGKVSDSCHIQEESVAELK